MTIPLRQSTASQEVPLGFFVDFEDGNTEETGLTISNTDIKLWKNGATSLVNKNSGGATHMSNGVYYAALDDTDTNTLGPLVIFIHVSGALPIRLECEVFPANVYDSLYGSDKLEVDTVQIEGSDATNQINAEVDAALADYDAPTHAELQSEINDVQSDIAALNDPSASEIADAVWDEAQSGHTTTGSFGDIIGDNLDATVSSRASQTSVNTIDDFLDTEIAAILADTNELQTDLTDGGRLDLLIDAIKAKTDNLPASPAAAGDIPTASAIADAVWDEDITTHNDADSAGEALQSASAPTAGDVADAVWDELIAGHTVANTFGKVFGDNINATISSRATQSSVDAIDDFVDTEVAAILAAVDTEVAAILADTNELQTDLTDGGRLDLLIDAIKAKTDNLPASPAAVGDIPTAGAIADAVWDEAIADHDDAGSAGEALASAGSAGDPWATALPGSYGAGTAGNIIGNNLNATISSRASQASLDTLDDYVDTEIAAILADTNELQTDLTDGGRLDLLIDAIKGKTDNLPSSPAAVGDIPSAASIADAVWDELRDDHTDTGSFGEGAASVQGDVTGSVDSVTDPVTVGTNNDKTGYGLADGAITASKIATDAITADKIAADAIGSSELAATAVTEIQSGLATAASLSTVDSNVSAIKAKTDNLPADPAGVSDIPAPGSIADAVWDEDITTHNDADSAGEALQSASAPTVGEIADAVWDEALSGHLSSGSAGEALDNAGSGSSASDIADAVWDELLSEHTDVGSAGAALTAAGSSGDPWATPLPGSYSSGTAGKIIGDNLNASVSSRASQASVDAIDDYIDTEIAAILADTNEIQGDLADGGRLDLLIDAIKAKTDNLPASPASVSDIPTALENAGAVWDEARSGHTASGSFGEGVASVQGDVTGSVDSVTDPVTVGTNNDKTGYGLANGAITAAVIASNAIDADSIASDAVTEIQSGLATASALSNLDADLVAVDAKIDIIDGVVDGIDTKLGSPVVSVSADIADVESKVDDLEGRLTAQRALNLDNLDASVSSRLPSSSYSAPPSAGAIADQVWDELLGDHNSAGSAGEALANISAGASPSDIADAVWDELRADHNISGSFGELEPLSGGVTVSDISTPALAKFLTVDTGETGAADGSVGKIAQGAGGIDLDDIWGYPSRTLTMSPEQIGESISGSLLTIKRGDTLDIDIAIGNLTDVENIFLTVKSALNLPDSQSTLQVSYEDGLLYVNGAEASAPADGEITIIHVASGLIKIKVGEAITSLLPSSRNLYWDIQADFPTRTVTMKQGTCHVYEDVTRSI